MTRRTALLLAALVVAVLVAAASVLLLRRQAEGPPRALDRRVPPPPTRRAIEQKQPEMSRAGVVVLEPVGDSGVSGTATLVELETGDGVRLELTLAGLSPGLHGLAVRELGDCAAPGNHFNPEGLHHSSPTAAAGHAGDLGNVVSAGPGKLTRATLVSRRMTLAVGPTRAMGRALVVHEGPDDMVTQPDGMAGRAVACGVIEPAR